MNLLVLKINAFPPPQKQKRKKKRFKWASILDFPVKSIDQ